MQPPNTLLRHRRYRIIQRIGQDGMGAVVEGQDLSLNVKVAVKQALVNQPALRRAFEKEAQRLVRLRHSALPKVIDLVWRGNRGALIAARNYGRQRYLAVVYRQVSADDGFIITAYFTRKINRKKAIWKRQ